MVTKCKILNLTLKTYELWRPQLGTISTVMVQFVCWFIQYTIRTSANGNLFTTATKTPPQLPNNNLSTTVSD